MPTDLALAVVAGLRCRRPGVGRRGVGRRWPHWRRPPATRELPAMASAGADRPGCPDRRRHRRRAVDSSRRSSRSRRRRWAAAQAACAGPATTAPRPWPCTRWPSCSLPVAGRRADALVAGHDPNWRSCFAALAAIVGYLLPGLVAGAPDHAAGRSRFRTACRTPSTC